MIQQDYQIFKAAMNIIANGEPILKDINFATDHFCLCSSSFLISHLEIRVTQYESGRWFISICITIMLQLLEMWYICGIIGYSQIRVITK
jgi:hypothetical protein